jgi:hypothetical protein
LLTLAVTLVACGSAKTPPTSTASNAQVVHCSAPEKGECFDTAKTLCGGPWHQVAEPGIAFPAIVNDERGGYRMLVACGADPSVK